MDVSCPFEIQRRRILELEPGSSDLVCRGDIVCPLDAFSRRRASPLARKLGAADALARQRGLVC